MMRLAHHKTDFGLDAEWHCYASSHGKCICDGLGASLKSEATRFSLQANPKDAILNSTDLFNWAKKKFKNIQFLYYTKEEHKKLLKTLNKKYTNPPAVTKIQSSHAFIPIAGNKLKVKRYSTAEDNVVIMHY